VYKYFDFQCPQGHVTEEFISGEPKDIECPKCGSPAKRIISPIVAIMDPLSGDFYGATRQWEKHREITIANERKALGQTS